jgi:hypothetical protein
MAVLTTAGPAQKLSLILLAGSVAACCGPAVASPEVATRTPTAAPTATPTHAPIPTYTPSPTALPGLLYVDGGREVGPISPLVYGTNTGPWQHLTTSMIAYVEVAGFRLLRFPGGNWGDTSLLTQQRFDEFIALAGELGAEPMVNVKLPNSSPEKAAGWVEYANITQGYGVRYWAIGNEPNLYASNGLIDGYDTAAFNQDWRSFALAMKAVDPSILLIGPELNQYTAVYWENPRDQNGRDWMEEFLLANGDLVDIVSFHRYPFGTFHTSISDLRSNSAEWDGIIPYLRALVWETTGRDLPIAVTEVNSNYTNEDGGEATPDSFYNAIWWADVLGRLIEQRVEMVAHFALEGAGGLGMMSFSSPRPMYYVYLLYREFGSQQVHASSDDPLVGIYAAMRADGALTVLVVNLGPDAATKPMRLDNVATGGSVEVWLLDQEHSAEEIGVQPFSNGDSISLPAQSVSLYTFPRQ